MSSPAVLIGSEDARWLRAAGEAVVRAGGVVVAECPDVVSLLAHAALDLADLVLIDPLTLTLDRAALIRLRRRGLRVVPVSAPAAGSGHFVSFEEALRGAAASEVRGGKPIVAIFGCRGAPGTTRLAIAAAQALARTDQATALLDLDPRGGAVAAYLRVPEDTSALVAMEALAAGGSWSFTYRRRALAVLVAPSRPGWCLDIVPADVGLLLDAVCQDRAVIVDAGAVGATVDELTHEILRRATRVVLVGRDDAVGRVHLVHAQSLLARHVGEVIVVTDTTEAGSADLARLLGTEQQHQAGRGVDQHRDRHGHTRRRPRLLGHPGRRHQRDGPVVGRHGSEHVADHDDDHLE